MKTVRTQTNRRPPIRARHRAEKPSSPPEQTLKATVDALRKIVQTLRAASNRSEASFGLSGAQLFVLQQLDEHPALSINELARLTLTDQSSVSVVVSRLVERKLVSRKTSPHDARRVELTLTARGSNQLKDAAELPQARLLRSLRGVSPARLQVLREVLDQVVGDLGVRDQPAPMFFEGKSR